MRSDKFQDRRHRFAFSERKSRCRGAAREKIPIGILFVRPERSDSEAPRLRLINHMPRRMAGHMIYMIRQWESDLPTGRQAPDRDSASRRNKGGEGYILMSVPPLAGRTPTKVGGATRNRPRMIPVFQQPPHLAGVYDSKISGSSRYEPALGLYLANIDLRPDS